jgi:Cu(I)/Ag(I) efflux system periplasmic protein CusF
MIRNAAMTLVLLSLALPAAAVSHHQPDAKTAAKSVALTDGEVRKLDKEAKKITIRHGAITNLDMPPMTMVFQVSDPAMLDQVKAGDKIRFAADKQAGGAYVVTQIESVK